MMPFEVTKGIFMVGGPEITDSRDGGYSDYRGQ
jgi:hypothetical protein